MRCRPTDHSSWEFLYCPCSCLRCPIRISLPARALIFKGKDWKKVHRRGVVGRVPDFQSGDSSSIPGGVRNFYFYPGTGRVSFVCVMSCISLAVAVTLCWSHIQDSRLCVSVWCSDPQSGTLPIGSDSRTFRLLVSGVKSYIGGV